MLLLSNPLRLGELGFQRKFFGTLYNTYAFFSLYANIDGFKFEEAVILRLHRLRQPRLFRLGI